MESILENWKRVANGSLPFGELYRIARAERRLTFLTIDVNVSCDLVCAACYYHPRIDAKKAAVSDAAIEAAIATARDELDLRNLAFAGKEPFLSPDRLFHLLRLAGSLQQTRGQFAIGVITNGRHIHKHWAELEDLAAREVLTFLDVSLDSGDAEQHDRIRGVAGTFDLAARAAAECQQRLEGVRIGISSVLYPDNGSGLIQLMRTFATHNRFFCVSPVQPPPYVAQLPLSGAAVVAFAGDVAALLNAELSGACIEVILQLPGPYVADLLGAGVFSMGDVREDAMGQCYVEFEIGGNTLVLGLSILPEYGWRMARITATGAYLSHAHFLQSPDPERFAVGFIDRDPITTLYERAKMPGSLFERLFRTRADHECRQRPCWSACFGGLTVSENDWLQGRLLTCQPSLCPKPPAVAA